MNFWLKRKCPCCKEKVISLWNIAYNLHIESKQRVCSKCDCKYEISKKWDALRRVLWILLIPLYLLPYFIFNDIINNDSKYFNQFPSNFNNTNINANNENNFNKI